MVQLILSIEIITIFLIIYILLKIIKNLILYSAEYKLNVASRDLVFIPIYSNWKEFEIIETLLNMNLTLEKIISVLSPLSAMTCLIVWYKTNEPFFISLLLVILITTLIIKTIYKVISLHRLNTNITIAILISLFLPDFWGAFIIKQLNNNETNYRIRLLKLNNMNKKVEWK